MKTKVFTLVAIAATALMSAQSSTTVKNGKTVVTPTQKEVVRRDPATGKTYIATPSSKPRSVAPTRTVVTKSGTRKSYIKNNKVVYKKTGHPNKGKHKGHYKGKRKGHHKGHHKNHK